MVRKSAVGVAVVAALALAASAEAVDPPGDPGACGNVRSLRSACLRGEAILVMRRAVGKFRGSPYLNQGFHACGGPGVTLNQTDPLSRASFLPDPRMRALEAKLHYRLTYVCAWWSLSTEGGLATVTFVRHRAASGRVYWTATTKVGPVCNFSERPSAATIATLLASRACP